MLRLFLLNLHTVNSDKVLYVASLDSLPLPVVRSECAYYFCLSWLITWFGHVVRRLDEACRLVDFLLASHPLMPVYLSGAVRENAHTHTHTTTQTHFKLFLD